MPIGNQCEKTYVKIVTKQTGKGAELVYAVNARTGTKIADIMTIGNKTGHVYLFKNIPSGIFTDRDAYGRVKVVATQGKARRC
jgi:hypothetical protein